jgi:SAM-dependent methyltransferase
MPDDVALTDARFPDTEPPGYKGFNAVLRERCGRTILDAACGKGRWAEWAIKHRRGYRGVDIDESLIALCQSQFPNFRFRVGDCRKLPFKPQSFDTVLLIEVLEHLRTTNDALRALQEACRVARRCVAVTTPDCTDAKRLSAAGLTFTHILESGKGRKFKSREDTAHAHWLFHTKDSLGELMSVLGHPFELYRTRRVGCLDFPCYTKLEAFIDLTGRA